MSPTELSRLAAQALLNLFAAVIAKSADARTWPQIRRGIADKCLHATTILSDNPNGELGATN